MKKDVASEIRCFLPAGRLRRWLQPVRPRGLRRADLQRYQAILAEGWDEAQPLQIRIGPNARARIYDGSRRLATYQGELVPVCITITCGTTPPLECTRHA